MCKREMDISSFVSPMCIYCDTWMCSRATLTAFSIGTCVSWTSPMIPKFASSDPTVSPIGRALTTLELAWIVSATSLGYIFGPLLYILCSKNFTKKTVLLIVSSPLLAAHIICIFAEEVKLFFIARFLMGIGSGAIWSVLGIYIAEISEDKNRGFLGSLTGVMVNLGCLFGYTFGPYLQLKVFSLVNLIPLVLYYVLFGFFVPDSPYDLLIKKKNLQAEKCLLKLRKHSKVQKELAFIAETLESSAKDDFKAYDLIKNKSLFKAFNICMGLMFFQQFSGVLAVYCYAETIFELAGSVIPSAVAAVIISLVSTISSIISCILVDKMGRRVLITISCTFVYLSLFILGIYFYLLNNGKDVSMLSWLPLVSLMVFMTAFNLGLSVLPFVVLGELFPSSVKSVAATVTSLFNNGLSFIITISFPYLVKYLGMAGTFWIFGGIVVIGSIFCLLFLPETKGKNFQEIQDILKGQNQ